MAAGGQASKSHSISLARRESIAKKRRRLAYEMKASEEAIWRKLAKAAAAEAAQLEEKPGGGYESS